MWHRWKKDGLYELYFALRDEMEQGRGLDRREYCLAGPTWLEQRKGVSEQEERTESRHLHTRRQALTQSLWPSLYQKGEGVHTTQDHDSYIIDRVSKRSKKIGYSRPPQPIIPPLQVYSPLTGEFPCERNPLTGSSLLWIPPPKKSIQAAAFQSEPILLFLWFNPICRLFVQIFHYETWTRGGVL